MFLLHTVNYTLIVLIYVDDIIVTGNCLSRVPQLIDQLNIQFALKDLGDLNYFLGIQVSRTSDSIHLCQQKYMIDLLTRVEILDVKPASTLVASDTILSLYDGEALHDPTSYRKIVGALQYCTITRPNLSFAVNKVCQYMHTPTTSHWCAVKRILRYIRGTLSHGIILHASTDFSLSSFTDADWASSSDDHRSTNGYCAFLGPNIISWSSTKQHVVSRSSTEFEYRGLANAAAEVLWLQTLLCELRIPPTSPPLLICDNISALHLAANPVLHARTKHIEIDYHFVRERVLDKSLAVDFTPSCDQLADIMTKPLPSTRFLVLRSKLTVVPHPIRLREDIKL